MAALRVRCKGCGGPLQQTGERKAVCIGNEECRAKHVKGADGEWNPIGFTTAEWAAVEAFAASGGK